MSEPSTSITEEQIAFEAMIGQLSAVLTEALESRGRLQNRVKELEGKLSTLTDQIEERDMKLAAMSEPPVWRDGPPPEPGWWWCRARGWEDGWFEVRRWTRGDIESGDYIPSMWRHAPVPANLKPPVEPEPKPEPKPDLCEEFIQANTNQHGEVVVDCIRFNPDGVRLIWKHIEAAIKGGAE